MLLGPGALGLLLVLTRPGTRGSVAGLEALQPGEGGPEQPGEGRSAARDEGSVLPGESRSSARVERSSQRGSGSLPPAELRPLHPVQTRRGAGAAPPGDGGSGAGSRGSRVRGWRRPEEEDDPGRFFTTRRPAPPPPAPGLVNPLYPLREGSCWAYLLLLAGLALFAAGVAGGLALMCIVCHGARLQCAWSCVLAGLALADFLVLFFCLPVVLFHELTGRRLLGDQGCGLVPFLEVTNLGVATFSLCALSIARFHAATGPAPHQAPRVEPCRSILSKMAVIWLGSVVLAAPELLLYRLLQEPVSIPPLANRSPSTATLPPPPAGLQQSRAAASLTAAFTPGSEAFRVDVCVREPWAELPEGVYSLVLTYQQARPWWLLGCFFLLPLLFTLACDLVTRQVLAHKPGDGLAPARSSSPSCKKPLPEGEEPLRATIMALAALYMCCGLPESAWSVALASVSPAVWAGLPAMALPALALLGQFLMFIRCAVAPLLLLRLSRPLRHAFLRCCCCCCDECLTRPPPSSSPPPPSYCSASTAATSSLSSPTPSSLAPSSKDGTVGNTAATTIRDRSRDASLAVGTPC